MELKHLSGVVFGIVSGLIISAILLVVYVVTLLFDLQYEPYTNVAAPGLISTAITVLSLGQYLIFAVIIIIAGFLTVWLARSWSENYRNAAVISGIAGFISGLVLAASNLLTGLIGAWIAYTYMSETYRNLVSSIPNNPLTYQSYQSFYTIGIYTGIGINICCCAPLFLGGCVVAALIGGCIAALIIHGMGKTDRPAAV